MQQNFPNLLSLLGHTFFLPNPKALGPMFQPLDAQMSATHHPKKQITWKEPRKKKVFAN
jgi:hypothetical protein